MNSRQMTIGTRGSDLALWQARYVRDILQREHGCDVALKIIQTSGDKIDSVSFDKMEGKGFFTKELEVALLSGEIDLAVHSLKDLMTSQPAGLMLGAIGYRADRREMLLVRRDAFIGEGVLPVRPDAVIGTGSPRRACQIAGFLPNARVRDLRGNVPTRINRLREGRFDAIIIAAAGVTRLNLSLIDLHVVLLDPEEFLPAPAQGILGIQVREDDGRVRSVVERLNSEADAAAAAIERGLLAKFAEGCSLPLGVFSEIDGPRFRLRAVLGRREGDGWGESRLTDVRGEDIDQVVDRAFFELTEERARCA